MQCASIPEGLLAELALQGRLAPEELSRWLGPLGIDQRAAVLVFAAPDPHALTPPLAAILEHAGARAIVTGCEGLLCAVVDWPSDGGPLELAARVRRELRARWGEVPAAVSRPAPIAVLRQSFQEARCALEAARASNGDGPEVASYENLGAFGLLLSLQHSEALSWYCHTVLGPVHAEDGEYGEELLRSVDAFIEHNGHWEQAAKSLYCHRHTLRYRVRRVEQLTGRDFARARDRIEFWLALRAREIAA